LPNFNAISEFDCRRIWEATSGRVSSVDEAEEKVKEWLKEKARREVEKEKIKKWREQKVAAKEEKNDKPTGEQGPAAFNIYGKECLTNKCIIA
jgi:hypothetical protein